MKKCVSDIVNKFLCSGCGGCQVICPKKCIDINLVNGRNVAIVNEDLCIECGICLKICPSVSNYNHINSEDEINLNYFGEIKKCMVGHSSNNHIRKNAASGGIVTSILKYAIANRIVDGVITVRADKKNPINNEIILVKDLRELMDTMGSRYSPISMCLGLNKIKNISGKFIFVGKPCEVEALKNIMEIDREIKSRIIFTISIMCHQNPSIKGTMEILYKNNIPMDEIKSLKYRGNGWPGKFEIITKDEDVFQMSYLDAWGKYICKYSNIACRMCANPFAKNADIVVGDPWGDEYKYEYYGKSVFLIRSQRAMDIINQMLKNKEIDAIECSVNHISRFQHELLKKIQNIKYMIEAYNIFIKKNINVINMFRKYKFNLNEYIRITKNILIIIKFKRG